MYPQETTLYHAILTAVMVLAVIILTFVVTVIYYQKRKLAFHKTNIRAEINALEKERARIAGDLHDDLGASLSAIKLKLQCLSINDEKERKLIGQSEDYIDEAMLKLKHISFNMMPQVLERKGLEEALREFISTIEQTIAVKISFRYSCPVLSNEKTIHIYRIVQEILNNIIKHAGASSATVELKKTKKKIWVHIADNGKGFNKNSAVKDSKGQGLRNIMARADLLNAKIFLTTAIGRGVDYLIQIPENI